MKIRRLIGSMLLAPWVEEDCLIVWLAELCADCLFFHLRMFLTVCAQP
ncbi:hypothetical protein BSAE_1769 [Bifidobacterium pullorum subsp. saeculare DSM 6531 = LMG 14934]|uniref:Uncharacterized protein n=1 Tax=Bifidobacterium pullorum subsp. saeculare DSM 6531 = LMG 14934 TaxID=1437611 RepID=A0A087CXY4_9BIFI|nr:hypothetical protein BSAE_1769 [Bifidobacterium pullorum subsp. saeculare DSM 6531 = LMG 14934]